MKMFKSKKCPKCNEKIKESYDFCPSCGKQLKGNEENWGMLGKNDFIEQSERIENPLFGVIGGGMLGKLLGSTMKMLEKELQKGMIENQKNKNNPNFELFINGKRIDPKNIQISKQPILKNKIQERKTKIINLPNNKLEEFSKLPQEEPKTSIRRLADSIVYDIELPGVKKEENISIRKIGESIEIRAISKNKAYIKTITINLPITNYEFSNETLILELENKN